MTSWKVGDLEMDIQCQTECFINHAQSFIRFHSFIHSSNKLRTQYGWVVCEVLGTPETRGMTVPHSGGLVLSPVSSFSSPLFIPAALPPCLLRSHHLLSRCLLWEYKQTTLA